MWRIANVVYPRALAVPPVPGASGSRVGVLPIARWLALLIQLAAVLSSLVACGTDNDPMQLAGPSGWSIDATALKLRVEAEPWHMRFFDAEGRELLVEHRDTGESPLGPVGFFLGEAPPANPALPPARRDQPQAAPARAGGWTHASRLLREWRDGAQWYGEVATENPNVRLEIGARPEGAGVISVRVRPLTPLPVQAVSIGFEAGPEERFYGFGERSNAVAQRGRAMEHYVGEGPYQNNEYPLVMQFVPPWGIRWRKDATYFPIPWLLSSRGYGVLVDNDALSYHRLDQPSGWSVETEDRELRFRVFAGPTPADVLARFSEAVGRQPRPYAPWFFGPWVQPDRDSRIAELVGADVPASVTATYTHYLPCGDQLRTAVPERDRTRALNLLGTAVHTYFNPMVCVAYEPVYSQAVAAQVLMKTRTGEPYVYNYSGSTIFRVSQFDFAAPGALSFYGRLVEAALADGHEGWMEDFGEYTPLDAVAADGLSGSALHNRYARDYHCGIHQVVRTLRKPIARFVRSGWTGSAACSPIVWNGDPTTSFDFDGLESAIYNGLSMGLSGVGIWGSDIGGFFALGANELTPELLDRWVAFGAMSPVMRTQANGFSVPPRVRPQVWDPPHLPIWRRYAKLRTQLWPYVQAAAEEYYNSGLPLMRHHLLTDAEDPRAVARDDQYLFGPDLLVAPVYRAGATERTLYLPKGPWVEWWRSVRYEEADGSFHLKQAQIWPGEREITVPAPADEIPVFVRAGAVIPLLAADVQTLADHGEGKVVRRADRLNYLQLLLFPRGSSSRRLFADESVHSHEREGKWSVEIQGPVGREVRWEATMATLERPFVPRAVDVEGGALHDWRYDPGRQVFVAHTTSGSTRMRIHVRP